jgi:hypothetical protein
MHKVGEGLRIKAARGRGAYVRNISYSNVTITSFYEHAIQANDFYGSHNPSCGLRNATATPRVELLENSNVRALTNLGDKPAADFEGLAERPITRVRMRNVVLPSSAGGGSEWSCKQVAGESSGVVPTPCKELQQQL